MNTHKGYTLTHTQVKHAWTHQDTHWHSLERTHLMFTGSFCCPKVQELPEGTPLAGCHGYEAADLRNKSFVWLGIMVFILEIDMTYKVIWIGFGIHKALILLRCSVALSASLSLFCSRHWFWDSWYVLPCAVSNGLCCPGTLGSLHVWSSDSSKHQRGVKKEGPEVKWVKNWCPTPSEVATLSEETVKSQSHLKLKLCGFSKGLAWGFEALANCFMEA